MILDYRAKFQAYKKGPVKKKLENPLNPGNSKVVTNHYRKIKTAAAKAPSTGLLAFEFGAEQRHCTIAPEMVSEVLENVTPKQVHLGVQPDSAPHASLVNALCASLSPIQDLSEGKIGTQYIWVQCMKMWSRQKSLWP